MDKTKVITAVTSTEGEGGQLSQDPHIQGPRRGMRQRISNRKFTEDFVK
jgi:hypothetical protein